VSTSGGEDLVDGAGPPHLSICCDGVANREVGQEGIRCPHDPLLAINEQESFLARGSGGTRPACRAATACCPTAGAHAGGTMVNLNTCAFSIRPDMSPDQPHKYGASRQTRRERLTHIVWPCIGEVMLRCASRWVAAYAASQSPEAARPRALCKRCPWPYGTTGGERFVVGKPEYEDGLDTIAVGRDDELVLCHQR
jgi:hypothetical protein